MPIKKFFKTLHSICNYQRTLTLDSRTFKIPIIQNMGLLNLKVKVSWFMQFIKDYKLPSNMSFLDIGVNVGQTLIQFTAVSDSPYFGFEPNPACVYYLNKLIEKNKLIRTHIIPIGLASKTNVSYFYHKHASDSAGTTVEALRPGYYRNEQKYFVPVFEYDTLNCSIDTVGLIKIDVEGAELEVLSGMQNTLAKHHPPVICEILDAHSEHSLKTMQDRAHQLVDLMYRLQYKMYRVNQSNAQVQYEPIENIILTLWNAQSTFLNDYLFWPSTKPFIYNI